MCAQVVICTGTCSVRMVAVGDRHARMLRNYRCKIISLLNYYCRTVVQYYSFFVTLISSLTFASHKLHQSFDHHQGDCRGTCFGFRVLCVALVCWKVFDRLIGLDCPEAAVTDT